MQLKTAFIAGLALAGFTALSPAARAEGAPARCGLNNGQKATGEPILVGGIHGDGPPGNFSGGTAAAAAYFACVNANGGIHGRPIDYRVENDQWNPEMAGQVAAKLVLDEKVVALVGNGSFVEMAVNAPLYARNDVMVMASGCAIAECYETSNIVSTNQGPVASGLGTLKYAVEELGTRNAACIGFNIPNNGGWACGWLKEYMESKGLKGTSILMDPTSIDLNAVYLQALAEGVDTILLMLPAEAAVGMLKVAEEQGGRDQFNWVSPTAIYDPSVVGVLGDYWRDKLFVNVELAPFDSTGPDNLNWQAVMAAWGKPGDRHDTFSQAGYLSAKFFVDALLPLDPAGIDRKTVTEAVKGITNATSDLLCSAFYVGEADRHLPNYAGRMLAYTGSGFKLGRDCYAPDDSNYLTAILAQEAALKAKQ